MATTETGEKRHLLQRLRRPGAEATTPVRALLLDLDDTLLINDMEVFSSHYYDLLAARIASICPPYTFFEALRAGTMAMFRNDGTGVSNADLFFAEFLPRVGDCGPALLPALDAFYAEDFDQLGQWTDVDPAARELVDLAGAQGLQLAVATQPVFPRVAIESRLRWAGVGPEACAYDAVSCFEDFDACKPHPRFYSAMCQRLGRQPQECVMVGDSVDADMAASRYGLRTFWVTRRPSVDADQVVCNARGSLQDLIQLLTSGEIHAI
jgi:FMN phosphatase YigB (HAD superfamily)